MAKVVVTKSKLDSLAQHINAKAGTTGAKTIAQMQATVDGISTKMSVTWHQCPEAVRNYIANVTYDPSDYSNSQIVNYAPATPVLTNERPIGKTVDGVTYYNEVPNTETPFATTNAAGTLKPLDALRQIWLPYVPNLQYNVRDLGGWACDGGKVKYGMMFRGGRLYSEFRDVLVDECGVRAELDLRGRNDVSDPPPATSPLGTDILFYVPDTYQWYSISNKTVWREMLRFVFDCVLHNQPVYFHCAMGADRTGTLACVIEALLGMSQSDIDKDYELTCFATGTNSDGAARRRNESEWMGLINQINALPGSTFRDKVVGWVATMGFTAAEINAFRAAMIDGTPETVTPSIDTYTVTNTLTNAASDNSDASAVEYQPYTAKITPANGYAISSVQIKMGGVDVTSSAWSGTETVLRRKVTTSLTHCTSDNSKVAVIDGQGYAATLTAAEGYTLDGATISILIGGVDVSTFYKDGVIAIPNVTGDLEITVTAIKSAVPYTNLIPTSVAPDGSIYNGIGYKNNTRLRTNGIDEAEYANHFATGFIPVTTEDTLYVKGCTWDNNFTKWVIYNEAMTTHGHDAFFGATTSGEWDTTYLTVTDMGDGVTAFVFKGQTNFGMVRLGAVGDGENVIITKNELIV